MPVRTRSGAVIVVSRGAYSVPVRRFGGAAIRRGPGFIIESAWPRRVRSPVASRFTRRPRRSASRPSRVAASATNGGSQSPLLSSGANTYNRAACAGVCVLASNPAAIKTSNDSAMSLRSYPRKLARDSLVSRARGWRAKNMSRSRSHTRASPIRASKRCASSCVTRSTSPGTAHHTALVGAPSSAQESYLGKELTAGVGGAASTSSVNVWRPDRA